MDAFWQDAPDGSVSLPRFLLLAPYSRSSAYASKRQKGMWGSESVCQRSHVSLREASFLLRVYAENKAACRQRKILEQTMKREKKLSLSVLVDEDGFILNLTSLRWRGFVARSNCMLDELRDIRWLFRDVIGYSGRLLRREDVHFCLAWLCIESKQ